MSTQVSITVEFTGGLEMLFENITKHQVKLPVKDEKGNAVTIKYLIPWLCKNLMKDSRKELFVLNGGIRPGILVLINDADWELEGEDKYELSNAWSTRKSYATLKQLLDEIQFLDG